MAAAQTIRWSWAIFYPSQAALKRPDQRQQKHAGDEDNRLQRQAEPPEIAEAIPARAHHQKIVLMPDGREEGAGGAVTDHYQHKARRRSCLH